MESVEDRPDDETVWSSPSHSPWKSPSAVISHITTALRRGPIMMTFQLCIADDTYALQQRMISDTPAKKAEPFQSGKCTELSSGFKSRSRNAGFSWMSKNRSLAQQCNRTTWRNIVSTENLRIIDAIRLHGRYAYELCFVPFPTERQ